VDRKDEDGASIVGSAGQHAANALPQRAWSSSGVKVWGLVGGVNHCSLHCRLTKFRGLMYRVKYGAVIGFIKPIARKLWLGAYKKTRFLANHSAVITLVHQTTEFRQTTVVDAPQVRVLGLGLGV